MSVAFIVITHFGQLWISILLKRFALFWYLDQLDRDFGGFSNAYNFREMWPALIASHWLSSEKESEDIKDEAFLCVQIQLPSIMDGQYQEQLQQNWMGN